MEESEFISRLKREDPAAFRMLISSYGKQVLNTCYRFLLNREEAEDIAQEVFIEVFQSIHGFRESSSLSTWIYRIAVTRSLDELRKQKRKKRISSAGKILHLDQVSDWLTGSSTASQTIETKDTMHVIQRILNRLPDNQRVAFTLSKVEGYSNPEIASLMNTSIEAVESLIYRAKKNVAADIERTLKNND